MIGDDYDFIRGRMRDLGLDTWSPGGAASKSPTPVPAPASGGYAPQQTGVTGPVVVKPRCLRWLGAPCLGACSNWSDCHMKRDKSLDGDADG